MKSLVLVLFSVFLSGGHELLRLHVRELLGLERAGFESRIGFHSKPNVCCRVSQMLLLQTSPQDATEVTTPSCHLLLLASTRCRAIVIVCDS